MGLNELLRLIKADLCDGEDCKLHIRPDIDLPNSVEQTIARAYTPLVMSTYGLSQNKHW